MYFLSKVFLFFKISAETGCYILELYLLYLLGFSMIPRGENIKYAFLIHFFRGNVPLNEILFIKVC
jgi:hypothetical protein